MLLQILFPYAFLKLKESTSRLHILVKVTLFDVCSNASFMYSVVFSFYISVVFINSYCDFAGFWKAVEVQCSWSL